MPKQDYLNSLGIQAKMTLDEVAAKLAEEEGSEKPLSRQRIRAIEQSALAKIRNNPEAMEQLKMYMYNQ